MYNVVAYSLCVISCRGVSSHGAYMALMKKAQMGCIGADAKTSLSLVMIRYSARPLVCYAPGAEIVLGVT